jgi:peptide deformylase
MAKLVAENHLALHSIAEEVTAEEFANGSVKKLIKKMREALRSYNVDGYVGVAIAAPQIGISKRVFLVEDQSKDREDALPSLVAINPVIIKTSRKKVVVGEGCLSVPDHYGAVSRHASVTLRATDENGAQYERGAGGLLAQIFQHECDHLDGTLFVDRADKVWTKAEADKMALSEAKD